MREVEPHEMSRGLGGIAHEMVVIGPNEGDKQIAHRIAEPCRPEQQQRFEGRKLRGTQIQNEHSYENGEDPVGERALWSFSRVARLSPFAPRCVAQLPRISVARFSTQEIADALSDFAGVHRSKSGWRLVTISTDNITET